MTPRFVSLLFTYCGKYDRANFYRGGLALRGIDSDPAIPRHDLLALARRWAVVPVWFLVFWAYVFLVTLVVVLGEDDDTLD